MKIKTKFSSKKINRQRVLMALLLTVKMNFFSLKTNYYSFLWFEKWFIKSGSLNLLVEKIRVLELSLKFSDIFPKTKFSDIFPKTKVYVKTLLIFSNRLQLKLPELLRKVRLPLTNWRQWRRKCSLDSAPFAQVHSGFNVSCELCLNL